jgi:formylglycine-generating enzyme required for sulfatase activity
MGILEGKCLLRTVVVFCRSCLALLTVLLVGHASARDYTNTLGMTFVLIPAGTFVMGRTESTESLRRAFPAFEASRIEQLTDEQPAHPVEITKSFYLGQHEVTVQKSRCQRRKLCADFRG